MGRKKNLSHKRDYKSERAAREKAKVQQDMSNRARKAAEQARERQYDDWDREALVAAIVADCKRLHAKWVPSRIEKLPFGFVKRAFLVKTSRHHVGGELVDFFGIDHVSVFECFGNNDPECLDMLSETLSVEEGTQWEIAFGDDPEDTSPLDSDTRDAIRKEFTERTGYAPNSVYAFMEAHPEQCTFDFSLDGERTVTVPVKNGAPYTCTIASAKENYLVGFDATQPEQESAQAAAQLDEDAKWHTKDIDIDVRDAVQILIEEREWYLKGHGFPSTSVRAYQDRYPERVESCTVGNTKKLKVKLRNTEFVCREADADITTVRGFDAVHGRVRKRAEAVANPFGIF